MQTPPPRFVLQSKPWLWAPSWLVAIRHAERAKAERREKRSMSRIEALRVLVKE